MKTYLHPLNLTESCYVFTKSLLTPSLIITKREKLELDPILSDVATSYFYKSILTKKKKTPLSFMLFYEIQLTSLLVSVDFHLTSYPTLFTEDLPFGSVFLCTLRKGL